MFKLLKFLRDKLIYIIVLIIIMFMLSIIIIANKKTEDYLAKRYNEFIEINIDEIEAIRICKGNKGIPKYIYEQCNGIILTDYDKIEHFFNLLKEMKKVYPNHPEYDEDYYLTIKRNGIERWYMDIFFQKNDKNAYLYDGFGTYGSIELYKWIKESIK